MKCSNSEFLQQLGRGCPSGAFLWFANRPNGALQWRGMPIDPRKIPAEVDQCSEHDTYVSAACFRPLPNGAIARTKQCFVRAVAIILDDVNPDGVGGFSWRFKTSDSKFQIGWFVDEDDPIGANIEIIDALMQIVGEMKPHDADPSGNNATRYGRAPVGINSKYANRPATVITGWTPSVRLSVEEIVGAIGLDFKSVVDRANGRRAQQSFTVSSGTSLMVPGSSVAGAQPAVPSEFALSHEVVGKQRDRMVMLLGRLMAGESLHDSILRLSAMLVQGGLNRGVVTNIMRAFVQVGEARRTRDPKILADRVNDIDRLVKGAVQKFDPGGLTEPDISALIESIDGATQDPNRIVLQPQDAMPGEVVEAAAVEPPAPPPRKLFLSIAELAAMMTATSWLLQGLIEASALVLMFGAPASGKSLVAYAMGFSIATGHPFFGRPVIESGLVIIIAGEGLRGISKRSAAWEKENNVKIPNENVFVSSRGAQLCDSLDAMLIAQEIEEIVKRVGRPPRLIIIDTLARNFGDGDENSAKDMGKFIHNVSTYIREPWNCCVLIVHHSGHNQDRARGSSALNAAVDSSYRVIAHGEDITVECHKMKDDVPPEPMAFRIIGVELGTDAEDRLITGATIIERDDPFKREFMRFDVSGKKLVVSIGDLCKFLLAEEAAGRAVRSQDVISAFGLADQREVRDALNRLVAAGFIDSHGRTKGMTFRLTQRTRELYSQLANELLDGFDAAQARAQDAIGPGSRPWTTAGSAAPADEPDQGDEDDDEPEPGA